MRLASSVPLCRSLPVEPRFARFGCGRLVPVYNPGIISSSSRPSEPSFGGLLELNLRLCAGG